MNEPSPLCVLNFICHASTSAVRGATFPSDEPLDQFGERDCREIGALTLRDGAKTRLAPEKRVQHTAELLGLRGDVAADLRECDFGRWKGRGFEAVMLAEPEAAKRWLSDPTATPHGGESLADVFQRVTQWMEQARALPVQHVIVAHASVMRAAVAHARGEPETDAMKIDIGSLTSAAIGWDGKWRLLHLHLWRKRETLILV